MRLIRIGVASTSVKVGDFSGNAARLREVVAAARNAGVHLLVTPELGLSGYSLEDRIWWPDIARRSWVALESLARECKGISVFVGLPVRMDGLVYNAAALIQDGSVAGLVFKKFLPTYSIFYEGRNWMPWTSGHTEVNGVPAGDLVFKLPYGVVSAEICEDLWAGHSPARDRVMAGAEVICNLSASPFTPCKNEQRRRLVLGASGRYACMYAYANLLGLDNSRLIFDGGGFVATPEAIVAEGGLLQTDYWTLASAVVNLDDLARFRAENSTWRQQAGRGDSPVNVRTVDCGTAPFQQAPVADYVKQMPTNFFFPSNDEVKTIGNSANGYLDELYAAMALGLRDYFEKSGVFQKFLVALSGGRDSALCLLLAVEAAKALRGGAKATSLADRVAAVYLPNRAFSSSATEDAARAMATELGVPFQVVAIEEEAAIALTKAEELMGEPGSVTPLAKQNLQARVRGNMMLNWANSAQGLLLVTSNLSEAAVGYTTTGGDNQGGLSPIANVPKTLVSRLLDYVAQRDGLTSIAKILAIPPSAELADDQRDEDDLMPYVILDDLLYIFARLRMSLPDCWRILVHRHPDHNTETLREWTARFGKLFAYNQWKREQLPVSLKVLDLDLDPKTGFRFPVTQSIQAELDELSTASL
ncbi:MAG: putative glutamine-dependent NAD(+) synthetase [Candidatus Hydrogenedentota bacterium]